MSNMRLHPEPASFATIAKFFIEGKLQNKFVEHRHNRYSLFFSDENIFYLGAEGLFTIQFKDSNDDLNIFKIDSNDFLIDKSFYSLSLFRGKKLPVDMDEKNYDLYHYKTSVKSPVTLHIVKEETGVLTEIWFEFQDSLLSNPSIKEDINTFLTC